eukprot:g6206.t1
MSPVSTKANVEDLHTSVDLTGKRIFVRVDLNAPLSKDSPPVVTNATRLSAACPTISLLAEKGAKVILASHLGRPKKQMVDGLRMDPVAVKLSELLGKEVIKMDDCIGAAVEARIASMGNGDIMLLENVRFHAGEESNDEEFSRQLAALCDYYVNDAFGTAHRAHASTEGITKFVERKVSGLLMEKELKYLKGAVEDPVRPMACIVGGAKVSSKITVIESLIEKCDVILLGGGMIFTFFKAKGLGVGKSLVEDDYLELARSLMEKAEAKGVKFLLPEDVVIADKFAADAESDTVAVDSIPEDWMGLDVGPKTISTFQEALAPCKTIVWNGPMGVFEFDKFATGTFAVADCLADLTSKGSITIIGGGDSVAAVEKANLGDKMSHISTGGGASLEMLEGKELPGLPSMAALIPVLPDRTPAALPFAVAAAPTTVESGDSLLLEVDETSSSSTTAAAGAGVNPIPLTPESDEMASLRLLEGEIVRVALGRDVCVASGDAVGFTIGLAVSASGAIVDGELGASVEGKTGVCVEETTGAAVGGRAGATVEGKTGAVVRGGIGAAVRGRTGAAVGISVGGSVSTASAALGGEVFGSMGETLGGEGIPVGGTLGVGIGERVATGGFVGGASATGAGVARAGSSETAASEEAPLVEEHTDSENVHPPSSMAQRKKSTVTASPAQSWSLTSKLQQNRAEYFSQSLAPASTKTG